MGTDGWLSFRRLSLEAYLRGSRGWTPRLYGRPTPAAKGGESRLPRLGPHYRRTTKRRSTRWGGRHRRANHPERN
jgi:hypothetical protein